MKMAHQYVVSAAAACALMLVLISAQSSHETSNKNMIDGMEVLKVTRGMFLHSMLTAAMSSLTGS